MIAQEASAGASAGILLVQIVLGLAWLGFQIWVITKIMGYSEGQYEAAGQNRTLWIALGALGICCLGPVIDLVWFLVIKPKLEQAPMAGGVAGFPPPPPMG